MAKLISADVTGGHGWFVKIRAFYRTVPTALVLAQTGGVVTGVDSRAGWIQLVGPAETPIVTQWTKLRVGVVLITSGRNAGQAAISRIEIVTV